TSPCEIEQVLQADYIRSLIRKRVEDAGANAGLRGEVNDYIDSIRQHPVQIIRTCFSQVGLNQFEAGIIPEGRKVEFLHASGIERIKVINTGHPRLPWHAEQPPDKVAANETRSSCD